MSVHEMIDTLAWSRGYRILGIYTYSATTTETTYAYIVLCLDVVCVYCHLNSYNATRDHPSFDSAVHFTWLMKLGEYSGVSTSPHEGCIFRSCKTFDGIEGERLTHLIYSWNIPEIFSHSLLLSAAAFGFYYFFYLSKTTKPVFGVCSTLLTYPIRCVCDFKDYTEALKVFQSSQRLFGSHYITHHNLGICRYTTALVMSWEDGY